MVSISEARQQIQQTEQQIQEQRGLIGQKREEAGKVETKIGEQKKKLPLPTQSRLRSGLYAGLEGRKRRQIISQAKKYLSGQEKEVGEFKKGLTEAEKEISLFETGQLTPFKQQVAQAEAEQAKINEYNRAVKTINKLIARDDWFIIAMEVRYGSGAMRKLAKEAIEMKKLARKAELKEQEVKQTISQSVPTSTFSLGVKPIYTNGKLVGIDDPIQKMCRLPTPAEELMYGQKVTPISSAKSSLFISTRDLPRTIKLKEVPTMGDINIFGTSIEVSELRDTMRTTGSPIRVTKLTGLKSRGYIPDRRPKPRITIKPKQIVKTPSFFKKDKKVSTKKSKFDDDFFFGKKIKKKFKKRNIWGF
jgi:hypothetical protein